MFTEVQCSCKMFRFASAKSRSTTAVLGLSTITAVLIVHQRRSRVKTNVTHCTGTPNVEGAKHNEKIFSKKTIVVTGAAGDIGSATAELFASKGSSVVLVDLPSTERRLEDLSSRLRHLGAEKVVITPGDVTSKEDMERMVRTAFSECGHVDFFFNNAGIQGELKPIHEQSEVMFRRVLDINVYGVYMCLKQVASGMIASGEKGGVIVNMASLAGLQGPPNMAAYAASKFAVVGLTKTAAKDLAPYGIRVCGVAPGLLESGMWPTQVKGQAQCRKKLEGVCVCVCVCVRVRVRVCVCMSSIMSLQCMSCDMRVTTKPMLFFGWTVSSMPIPHHKAISK